MTTLKDVQQRDGEDAFEYFERVAALFQRDTGYLRPGKDCVINSPEVRMAAWKKWISDIRKGKA